MAVQNPMLLEINTRVWVKRFQKIITLCDVPDGYWENIANKGFNYIWLMGVWKTCPSSIKKYCFEDFLVRGYERALRDWKEEDVIGSPYAIDVYEINPLLGNLDTLVQLKSKLNKLGLKLILDFVPNHYNAESCLIKSHPEIFLEVDEEIFLRDQHTYFKVEEMGRYFAHGRDPFFPAWKDTVQVNYFSEEAMDFMTSTLIDIAAYCDGVRCDMAMLLLENSFASTWSGALNKMGYSQPRKNFWETAIKMIKDLYPDFIFIAETYWNLEYELQQLGFDYTYDKRLMERLIHSPVSEIRVHLTADLNFQRKLVRFLENHDEERAAGVLSRQKLQAASVVISTIPGMRFYYDRQFDGNRIKLPVQLGREPVEKPNELIVQFFENLLSITKNRIFNEGNWNMLYPLPAWEGNSTYQNFLIWNWNYKMENRLVIINYSEVKSYCRVKLDLRGYGEYFTISDLLSNASYLRSTEEVYYSGLYIELKPFQSHIFSY